MNRTLALSQAALASAALVLSAAPLAHADTVSVQANAVIYAADTQSSLAPSVGGTTPTAISIASGNQSFTFATTGTITLNGGTYNDADGNFAATSSSSNSGYGYISGISAPGAGYLVGVFLPSSTLSSAPAATNYTAAGAESASSYSPLLGQVFFIGDGLTGDGTGSVQNFLTPTGAATLYLGISDAGGYNGGPGSYGDNFGAFSVNVTAVGSAVPPPPPPVSSPVPEPSSMLLLGTGALGMASAVRRRLQR